MELLGLFIILLAIAGIACIAIAFTSYSIDEPFALVGFIVIGIIFLITALPLKDITVNREANFSVTQMSLNSYGLINDANSIFIPKSVGDFELGEIVRLKYSEKPFGILKETIEVIENEN